MGATTIATIIAMVAAKLLGAYWGRTDVTDAAKYRVSQYMDKANAARGVWVNAAWADPARAAAFGLLPGAQGLRPDFPDNPTPGGPR